MEDKEVIYEKIAFTIFMLVVLWELRGINIGINRIYHLQCVNRLKSDNPADVASTEASK